MKLNEMKQLLAEQNIRLTKSLGQNFLHDANQLRRIVAAAELTKSDRVLEIGPGLGPLTELLVQQAGQVLAIETDAKLLSVLRERFRVGQTSHPPNAAQISKPAVSPISSRQAVASGPACRLETRDTAGLETCATRLGSALDGATPALRLLHDDALDYLRREARDWSEWKLVANLPYSVASPILVELAQARRGPKRMVATLQLEVAKRLLAKPGEPDYGLLTLLVQLDYAPQSWFKVPAGCFFPEPDVDSACACLVRREQPMLPPERRGTFAAVVKRSFSQRRKMMFKLLKQDWPEPRLAAEFERLNLSPRIRAEEVSLEQFAELAHGLSAHSR